MAGAPTPFVNSFQEPNLGSLRYNTSQAGSPLPICWGTQRISINLLEFWGFMGGTGGGLFKGGLTGKSSNGKKAGHFSVNIAMAICQGPVSLTGASHGSGGNNRIWANAGIQYGLAAVGLNGFAGNDGQAPDSVFAASDPNTPVLGYSGTAYVTGDPLQLGQSPVVPNLSFEVTGFLAGTAGPNFPDDANPGLIVIDLLTNLRYGAGFPAGNLDTLTDFKNYCQAANLAMSKLADRCEPAARYVEEICDLCVAAPFWSGALFKIVPYTTASYSYNSGSYTPNLTPIYTVDDINLIDWGGGSDPIIITRRDPTQATNWKAVEYLDSDNAYNNNIAYAFDQGAIDQYGLRNEAPEEGHSFTNIVSAQASAQLKLQREQLVRNTFKFRLGWNFSLLDPMDIIALNDPGAALLDLPVRITSISEDDDFNLTFEAEELGAVTRAIPNYTSPSAGSNVPSIYADPGNANSPIIFEPDTLSGTTDEVWLISSGGANWGGANVWVSTDGTNYSQAGVILAGARQGLLTATLPSFSTTNPDNTNTLSVDLTESLASLVSYSSGDASAGLSLCYVDGELLSYQTATLTATYKYNLTTLYRHLYGTTGGSHPSGSVFAFLGLSNSPAGTLKYKYPSTLVGRTISIKLQSFNTFFNSTQDLGSVPVYTYTLVG